MDMNARRQRLDTLVAAGQKIASEIAELKAQMEATPGELTDLELKANVARLVSLRDRSVDQVEGAAMADEISRCETLLSERRVSEGDADNMPDDELAKAIARHTLDMERSTDANQINAIDQKLKRLSAIQVARTSVPTRTAKCSKKKGSRKGSKRR